MGSLNFSFYFTTKSFFAFNLQIISGNTDTETVVSHRLMPTVYATKIRVLPYSVHRRTVCLRVEIKGCPAGGEFLFAREFFLLRVIKFSA